MRLPASILAALLAVALAAPVAAQESASENEIVVTGRQPLSPREFERAVGEFVRDLGETGPINRISRWGDRVCPVVLGLSEPLNTFVARRVEAVAEVAGVPSDGDCSEGGNALVLFTTRPDRMLSDIRKRHPHLLGYHFIGQRAALARFEPPMKSWYVTKTVIPGAYEAIDRAYAPAPPGNAGSRIRPPYKSRFVFALVVVDANLLEGREIGAVADKVAMLALSNPDSPQGCSALPSALDYLQPGCARSESEAGLTAYDRTYLRALYDFDRDELKGYQRGEIAKRIEAELGQLTRAEP